MIQTFYLSLVVVAVVALLIIVGNSEARTTPHPAYQEACYHVTMQATGQYLGVICVRPAE